MKDMFSKWEQHGVGFFLHMGAFANVPGDQREAFVRDFYPEATNFHVGRKWTNGEWSTDRYELVLPVEAIEPLREYLRDLDRLVKPIYADA